MVAADGEAMRSKTGKTKRIAVLAMLSALGVVILYAGAIISVMDISVAVIASMLAVFAVIEYGKSAPWLVFAVTSVLSLLLLPQKSPAVMYALFFGYYPILKEKYEKKGKIFGWVLKEATFHVAIIVMYFALRIVAFESVNMPVIMLAVTLVLVEIVFPLYDVALTRVISFYIYRLRSRFKIK